MGPEEPEPMDEDPPVVELTADEKAIRFFKHPIPDLTPYNLAMSFTKFSLPQKSEGFDTVKYSWNTEKAAIGYVDDWIREQKITTRVEDVSPSDWFKEKVAKWNTQLAAWRTQQNEYKANCAKKAADKAAKEAARAERKRAREQKKALAESRKLMAQKLAALEVERKKKEEADKANQAEQKAQDGEEKPKEGEEK